MNIIENCQKLITSYQKIVASINKKGGSMSQSDGLTSVVSKINSLYTDGIIVWTDRDENNNPTSIEVRQNPGNFFNFQGSQHLKSLRIKPTVTELTNINLSNCSNLEEVEIPKSILEPITSGNQLSFTNCTSLKNLDSLFDLQKERAESGGQMITFNSSTFANCSNLEYDGELHLSYVYSDLFTGCSKLNPSDIYLHDGNVASRAFSGCTSLGAVNIHVLGTGNNVNSQAFEGCTNLQLRSLPEQWTYIYEGAFSGCTSLRLEDGFGSNIKSIYNGAFAGCTSLDHLTFPPSTYWVDSYAFSTSSLKSVLWQSTETYFRGFCGCPQLETFTIDSNYPGDVFYMYSPGFDGDTSLRSFKSLANINGFYMRDYVFRNCSSLVEFDVPGVSTNPTYIGTSAFEGCGLKTECSLRNMDISQINSRGFADCKDLESFKIIRSTNSSTSISSSSFDGCTALKTFDIEGSGYISLGSRVFYGCTSLETITLTTQSSAPIYMGDDAFAGVDGVTLNVSVSEGSISGYPWGATNLTVNYDYVRPS